MEIFTKKKTNGLKTIFYIEQQCYRKPLAYS